MEYNRQNLLEPIYWKEATAYLIEKDRILKKIIPICNKKFKIIHKNYFAVLSRSIIGQQISNKTADKIWNMLINEVNIEPNAILMFSKEKFQSIGIPSRKADYLHNLALNFYEKKVQYDKWDIMDNNSIITELLSIKGIGRWTAEIFLIFGMHRPDIMPLDDLGLLKAISFHYFSGEPVSRFEAREVSVAWKPWRTVASWYLWQSLNFLPFE